jgi:hypothetical protein
MTAFPSAAETAGLRLLCTVYKSSDGTAERDVPRRKDLITVQYSVAGEATITSKLHEKQLTGTITEHEISGRWRGPESSEEIYINRYTTEYRYRVVFDDGTRSPTAIFGSCQMAGKPTS